jgi:hypothetical protein
MLKYIAGKVITRIIAIHLHSNVATSKDMFRVFQGWLRRVRCLDRREAAISEAPAASRFMVVNKTSLKLVAQLYTLLLLSCLGYSSSLKMGTRFSSETSGSLQPMRLYMCMSKSRRVVTRKRSLYPVEANHSLSTSTQNGNITGRFVFDSANKETPTFPGINHI